MRNLVYNIFNGQQRVATVNTLEKAQHWVKRGRRAVAALENAGVSPEEQEALDKFYAKVREKNPANLDRRAIRFKAV
jgi:hypothetical protein